MGQNKYTITIFFPRKVTFMFTFQENSVFPFTSLVLKGHVYNESSSLGNWSQL